MAGLLACATIVAASLLTGRVSVAPPLTGTES
jgi:hypothetical protein